MFDLAQIRRISAVAFLAMVMAVFAPTVSRIVAAEPTGYNMVEVCTAEGMKWVSVSEIQQVSSTGQQHEPVGAHDHGGDCPYCSLQTTKFLSVASQSFATTSVVSLLPPLFYKASKPLFGWAHARSRAPPHISA
jgi:acid phosphatase class B